MKARLSYDRISQHCERLPKALLSLGDTPSSVLANTLINLVKLRVSQINGCAFCLAMHSHEARKAGEAQIRIDVLSCWREAPCFNAQERAALNWAETLTQLASAPIDDAAFLEVKAQFNDAALIELTAQIVAINGWNRVSAGFGFTPDVGELHEPLSQ